jgi:hypothetical protein
LKLEPRTCITRLAPSIPSPPFLYRPTPPLEGGATLVYGTRHHHASTKLDASTSSIQICLPAPASSFSVFRPSKYASLFYSHLITHVPFTFLQADASHYVTVLRFSAKWSCAPRKAHRESELHRIQALVFPPPPNSFTTHKLAALREYSDNTDRSTGAMSRTPRPGSHTFHPPFLLGVATRNKYHHRQLATLHSRYTLPH